MLFFLVNIIITAGLLENTPKRKMKVLELRNYDTEANKNLVEALNKDKMLEGLIIGFSESHGFNSLLPILECVNNSQLTCIHFIISTLSLSFILIDC